MKQAINPGFKAIVRRDPFPVNGGVVLRCPKCKKVFAQLDASIFYIRCRGCRHWVCLEKVEAG